MDETSYPTLSLKERDWRWKRVRELMAANKLDCLILAGLNSFQQFERYLSNDHQGGIVLFPLKGDPTYLVRSNMDVISNMEDLREGGNSWIEDWRGGVTGEVLANVLRERCFDSATIGVVGLTCFGMIHHPEGYIPYTTWAHVLKELPRATFIDVFEPFIELMLIKSDEDLKLLRHVARIGEMAAEVTFKMVRPGVAENEIYATIMHTIYMNGGNTPHGFIIHSGPSNISWMYPKWITKAQRPRRIQQGEILLAEMFPNYGGLEAQLQLTVALKPVDPINKELAEVAKSSNEAGLKALRPGKTFEDVCNAMEEPIAEAGCWHLTPLIHSLNPLQLVSQRQVGMLDNLPGIEGYDAKRWEKVVGYKNTRARPIIGGSVVMRSGMCFAFEPNACRGKHRINIGSTVVITEHGVEELAPFTTEMRVVD